MTRALGMRSRRAAAGVTLVELMIGLAIGLLLLLGVFSLYLAHQQTTRTQDALNDQTETLGSLTATVTREVRRAGFNLLDEPISAWLSVDGDARGVRLRYRPPDAADEVALHLRWDADTGTVTSSRNGDPEVPLHPVGGITDVEITCFAARDAPATDCAGVTDPLALAWTVTLAGAANADVRARELRFVTTARNGLIAND